MTDQQRAKIDKVFDDLYKAGVPEARVVASLGCSIKAARKGLARAKARADALIPVAGRRLMCAAITTRSNSWHSVDLGRTHLTAYARSDAPFRRRETDP